jgi:flagellar protein FliO/FliZ
MMARLLLSLLFALACCQRAGAAGDAPAAPSTPVSAAADASAPPVAPVLAPATAPVTAPAAGTAAASAPMPLASASAGSLLQTILALSFVLALLVGLAWFMKRYGPKPGAGGAKLRVIGALSLGGRERVMLIEVADQWIVVGAAPGRVNLLSTMPRQPGQDSELGAAPGLAGSNFAEWLKQTIDKRNGK